MKVTLPESARERHRSFGGATASTLLHAVLIGGTVVATGATVERERTPPPPPNLVYVIPERPREPVTRAVPERRRIEIPTNVQPVPVVDAAPPDLSFIPKGLPPVTSTIGTMRIEDFRVASRDTTPLQPAAGPGEAWTALTVEKPVRARDGNPTPRYPPLLQASGIEGAIHARFVVDTAGRVEGESIEFTRSDHVLFERAVREVLLRSRYHPAEVGRQRVRQLVEQGFAFALRR